MSKSDRQAKKSNRSGKRSPKAKIPLSFSKAIEGLLAVKPEPKKK